MKRQELECGSGILPLKLLKSRLKVLMASLILLLIMLPLSAKLIELQVLDPEGKALDNVRVTHAGGTAVSDSEGKVAVSSRSERVSFSRLGYNDLSLSLKDIAQYTIVLQRAELVHPLIRVRELEYRSATPALDTELIYSDTNSATRSGADLLLDTSSFSSSDNRLLGERQTISLLGSFSRHTLVLLDGVALNAAGEAFDFSKIPATQIERIEIIKGNSSAYAGSAAIGGIVNIVTKSPLRARGLDINAHSSIGSYSMARQQYELSYLQKAWTLRVNYEHYFARNDFSYDAWWDPGNSYSRKHNAKTADNFFLKTAFHSGKQNLEYTLGLGSFIRQLPGPINFPDLYDDSRLSGSHSYHTLKHQWQRGELRNEAQIFHQSDGSSFRNLASTNPLNPSHYAQAQINIGVQDRLSWMWRQSSLEGITEYKTLTYDFTQHNVYGSGSTTSKGERDNFALGLRAGQKYGLSFVQGYSQLSLRRDYADSEVHDSWRAEQDFSYQASLKYRLGASYGTAFSLPSLYDMYWIGDSETMGNPELQSEISEGYSLRAALEHENWQVQAAYHLNEIENLIQWRQIFLFGSHWKPFNVGKARITNYELSGQWQLSRLLSVKGGLTLTEAKDFSIKEDGSPSATYGKHLTHTPRLKSQLALKLADESRAVTINWNHTGEQYSTVDNLIDPLPGFSNLDLDLMHKFRIYRFELMLDARLANILNQRYEIYAYIPQPGFNWATGLKLSYSLR